MNDKDQTSTEKILVEIPVTLSGYLKNSLNCSSYKERPDLMTICNCDLDALNRYLVLCSNRESKDSINLDYKTLKKSKGLYDIRSLDFKIVEANDLDLLNLFYIDGKLCGWRRAKTGDREIVEIKSEDDLMDYNKYDKKFKTILSVFCGIATALNVLASIICWIR